MHRVEGHFGEVIQGRMGATGPVVLVTLPCPTFAACAKWLAPGPLSLDQTPEVVSLTQIRVMLRALNLAEAHLSLTTTMPPGGGAGASTAALMAVARACEKRGGRLAVSALAHACLQAEGASDPLMFRRAGRVVWAPREGRMLGRVPPPPAAQIIGGFWGAPCRTQPDDHSFDDVSDLVRLWQAADFRAGDVAQWAQLATASAARCTARRGPYNDPTAQLSRDLGAAGYLRGHTGSARGFIFAPHTAPEHWRDTLRAAGFTNLVDFQTGEAR